jgi:hypothetical protein
LGFRDFIDYAFNIGDAFGGTISMTLVFIIGMEIKSPKRFWSLGLDSWAAIIFYILGVVGLLLV